MTSSVSNVIGAWIQRLDDSLHEQNAFTNILAQLENKTGLKRLQIFLGTVAAVAIYLMVGYGSDFLCNFIGFAYPAYKSIKAIESPEKDDDTKWLIYWVVYSVFLLFEYFTDIFLSWIPFYWLPKCIFLIYCMAPEPFSGSLRIYKNIIRPIFLKHEATIDRGVEQVSAFGSGLADEAKSIAEDVATDSLKKHLE